VDLVAYAIRMAARNFRVGQGTNQGHATTSEREADDELRSAVIPDATSY
jgi:hypothetical protein